MTESGRVNFKIEKGIGKIVFGHPKSNSLPGVLLRKLSRTIDELAGNPDARVIILSSEGDGAFCAGASFDELLEIESFDEAKIFFLGFADVILSMIKCPKFIIGRIHGKAVGGGVGLISACDYAIGVKNSSVRLSELSLGIGPSVIGPAVERKIGKSAFTSMTIDQAWHSARWAESKGLFSKVVESIADLDVEVRTLSEVLAAESPDAMKKLKEMFWEETKDWDELLGKRAEMSGGLVLSDFTKNYIRKFKKMK